MTSHRTPRAAAGADTLALAQALDRSAPLAQLMKRLQASNACLAAVLPALADGLRTQIQAGPLDETGWTLLAANAAAASKLRQMLPTLEALLREQALPGIPIRIKVQLPSEGA